MLTIVESPIFQSQWSDYWSEKEKDEFFVHIALNPEAGDVVPKSGGVRKIRWSRPGVGKRGGTRVIYFNRLANGEVWLMLIYGKSVRDNISADVLKQLKQELENATD
jgi:hypothetical protein